MQRITRLLSGSDPDNPDSNPSRSKRWRFPATLAILLASGTLLATQVDVRGTFMPGLYFQSTTDGVLRPGDSREIRANGVDKQRFYRASVDKAGKLSESYEEDGKPHAIDKSVRAWVNEMTRLATAPPPPPPPVPAATSAAPAPPAPPRKFDGTVELIGPPAPPPAAPPAPPAPPAISESASFKEILRLVAADQGVIRAMGNPLTVLPDSVDGNLRLSGINDRQGEALLSFDLSGPNGRNKVTVAAEREDGVWQIETLRLRPVGR